MSIPAEGDLGMLADSGLSVSQHSAKRANSILGCIKHSITSLPREVIILLYSELVQPHLGYLLAVQGPSN